MPDLSAATSLVVSISFWVRQAEAVATKANTKFPMGATAVSLPYILSARQLERIETFTAD